MRRILMVDANPLVGRVMHACLKQHGHEARRDALCAKAFHDFNLLGVIDDCLPEAEPHRRIVAASSARSGPQGSDGVERHDRKSEIRDTGTRAKRASS